MRFKSILAPLFGLFFFLPNALDAMHIIGGEITYEYLQDVSPTQKRFRFTLKVYRDCNGGGAPFDDPAEIGIYRGTYSTASLFDNFKVGISNQSSIPAVPPPCISNIPNVCVEQATYVFERTLTNLSTGSYFIVYQRCCRNESISNLVNPGDQGATYFVEITANAMALNNNSPVFNNFPPIIICNNLPLFFDHSATDEDGDLLRYEFCSPHNGGGPILQAPDLYSCEGALPTPPCGPPFDNVFYVTPTYTPTVPMGGTPTITISSTSGQITGTPNRLGQFVVGVCVSEFRGAELLSVVKRDFQFNVADCRPEVYANIQSDTSFVGKRYVVVSCGKNTVNFKNLSQDKNKISEFKWTFDLKGSTFIDESNWDATVTFPDTGTYSGTLYLNPGKPCADTGYILVKIFPEVNASFSYDYDTCIAGPVTFTDKSYGKGGVNRWQWDFGVPGGSSKDQHPEYLYDYPGDHLVHLTVRDKNNCRDDSVAVIAWYPAPPYIIVQPDKFLGCIPGDIFFNNLSRPIDSTYLIIWDFGDGQRDTGTISPHHVYTEPGDYDVKLYITSPIGCFVSDSFENWIKVRPSPTALFTCDPDSNLSQFNKTVKFLDQSLLTSRWNWQIGPKQTSEQNPTYTFPDTGRYEVTLIVTHAEGCKDTLTKVLDVIPQIRWYMPNAFTPNGDGGNDGFLGKGVLDGVLDFNMTIWNRWGEMVFETSDPEEAWNGRVKNVGGMSPSGVYVYLVTFTGPRGERLEYRGFATLVL